MVRETVSAGRFAGMTALVTGGASGIGRECCVALAREGAAVVVTDLDEQGGEATARQIRDTGAEATFVKMDVARHDEVAGAFRAALEWKGALHVVCHAAGVESTGSVTDVDAAEWERAISVNLTGTYHVGRHAVRALAAAGGGALVNVASLYGTVGTRNMAAYCASKGGVVMLTRAMALDHAAQRVRVNAVCPGPVRTPMLGRIFAGLRKAGVGVGDSGLGDIPLGRMASPSDVAAAVLYLASPDAGHVTGVTLPVDGGASSR